MKVIPQAASILLLVLCLGCAGVSSQELVGEWEMREESVSLMLPALVGDRPSLTLRSDGTFSATNLPSEIGRGENPVTHGKWKLEGPGNESGRLAAALWQGGLQLQLDFKRRELSGAEVRFSSREFMAHSYRGEPVIFYFRGDPDEGRRVEYLRAGSTGH